MSPEDRNHKKIANLAVAMPIGDLARPNRYLEIRGEVVAFERFETLAWVNQLARKYTGADFTGARAVSTVASTRGRSASMSGPGRADEGTTPRDATECRDRSHVRKHLSSLHALT